MHLHRSIVGTHHPSPHLSVDVLQPGDFDAVREHRVEAACLLQAAGPRRSYINLKGTVHASQSLISLSSHRPKAKPGQEKTLEKALREVAAPTRAQPGCISFSLHHSA
jgi:acetyl esterase/lipase